MVIRYLSPPPPVSHLHSGGLPCSIMPKERRNLSFIEVDTQVIHSQLLASLVDLEQVADRSS